MTTKKKKTRLEVLSELYEKLREPIPDDALTKDISRGTSFPLTSIKAQYIKKRLNEVLGMANWRLDGDYSEREGGDVEFQGRLIIFYGDYLDNPSEEELKHSTHTVHAYGYSKLKKLYGDTKKSARTDALSKAASEIGIGEEVFMGERPAHELPSSTTKQSSSFQDKKANNKSVDDSW
jgi:hypothetical protein